MTALLELAGCTGYHATCLTPILWAIVFLAAVSALANLLGTYMIRPPGRLAGRPGRAPQRPPPRQPAPAAPGGRTPWPPLTSSPRPQRHQPLKKSSPWAAGRASAGTSASVLSAAGSCGAWAATPSTAPTAGPRSTAQRAVSAAAAEDLLSLNKKPERPGRSTPAPASATWPPWPTPPG